MKKQPLIDLCFYSEVHADDWIRCNPKFAETTRFKDDRRRHHFVFRCGDRPREEGPIKNQLGKTIGYWKPASAEMRLIAESMGKNRERN